MKTENNKAINLLIEKIVSIVDTKISTLKFDKTFKSTVWGINSDGTYKISYKNQIYNVPNALGTELSLGQAVWVKIPCGIFRYIHICGIAK